MVETTTWSVLIDCFLLLVFRWWWLMYPRSWNPISRLRRPKRPQCRYSWSNLEIVTFLVGLYCEQYCTCDPVLGFLLVISIGIGMAWSVAVHAQSHNAHMHYTYRDYHRQWSYLRNIAIATDELRIRIYFTRHMTWPQGSSWPRCDRSVTMPPQRGGRATSAGNFSILAQKICSIAGRLLSIKGYAYCILGWFADHWPVGRIKHASSTTVQTKPPLIVKRTKMHSFKFVCFTPGYREHFIMITLITNGKVTYIIIVRRIRLRLRIRSQWALQPKRYRSIDCI